MLKPDHSGTPHLATQHSGNEKRPTPNNFSVLSSLPPHSYVLIEVAIHELKHTHNWELLRWGEQCAVAREFLITAHVLHYNSSRVVKGLYILLFLQNYKIIVNVWNLM